MPLSDWLANIRVELSLQRHLREAPPRRREAGRKLNSQVTNAEDRTLLSGTGVDAQNDDIVVEQQNSPIQLNVLSNDSTSGSGLSIVNYSSPISGSLTLIDGDESQGEQDALLFTPDTTDFAGSLLVTYTVQDESGSEDTASVILVVQPPTELGSDVDYGLDGLVTLSSGFRVGPQAGFTTQMDGSFSIADSISSSTTTTLQGDDGLTYTQTVTITDTLDAERTEFADGTWDYTESFVRSTQVTITSAESQQLDYTPYLAVRSDEYEFAASSDGSTTTYTHTASGIVDITGASILTTTLVSDSGDWQDSSSDQWSEDLLYETVFTSSLNHSTNTATGNIVGTTSKVRTQTNSYERIAYEGETTADPSGGNNGENGGSTSGSGGGTYSSGSGGEYGSGSQYGTGSTGSQYGSGSEYYSSTGSEYSGGTTGSSYTGGSTGSQYTGGSTGSQYTGGSTGSSYTGSYTGGSTGSSYTGGTTGSEYTSGAYTSGSGGPTPGSGGSTPGSGGSTPGSGGSTPGSGGSTPGSGGSTPGSGGYTPGSGGYTPGSGGYTPGGGGYTPSGSSGGPETSSVTWTWTTSGSVSVSYGPDPGGNFFAMKTGSETTTGSASGTYSYDVTGGTVSGVIGGSSQVTVTYNDTPSTKYENEFGYRDVWYSGSGGYAYEIAGGSVAGTITENGFDHNDWNFTTIDTWTSGGWTASGSGFGGANGYSNWSANGSGAYAFSGGTSSSGTTTESSFLYTHHNSQWTSDRDSDGWSITTLTGTGGQTSNGTHSYVGNGTFSYDQGGTVSGTVNEFGSQTQTYISNTTLHGLNADGSQDVTGTATGTSFTNDFVGYNGGGSISLDVPTDGGGTTSLSGTLSANGTQNNSTQMSWEETLVSGGSWEVTSGSGTASGSRTRHQTTSASGSHDLSIAGGTVFGTLDVSNGEHQTTQYSLDLTANADGTWQSSGSGSDRTWGDSSVGFFGHTGSSGFAFSGGAGAGSGGPGASGGPSTTVSMTGSFAMRTLNAGTYDYTVRTKKAADDDDWEVTGGDGTTTGEVLDFTSWNSSGTYSTDVDGSVISGTITDTGQVGSAYEFEQDYELDLPAGSGSGSGGGGGGSTSGSGAGSSPWKLINGSGSGLAYEILNYAKVGSGTLTVGGGTAGSGSGSGAGTSSGVGALTGTYNESETSNSKFMLTWEDEANAATGEMEIVGGRGMTLAETDTSSDYSLSGTWTDGGLSGTITVSADDSVETGFGQRLELSGDEIKAVDGAGFVTVKNSSDTIFGGGGTHSFEVNGGSITGPLTLSNTEGDETEIYMVFELNGDEWEMASSASVILLHDGEDKPQIVGAGSVPAGNPGRTPQAGPWIFTASGGDSFVSVNSSNNLSFTGSGAFSWTDASGNTTTGTMTSSFSNNDSFDLRIDLGLDAAGEGLEATDGSMTISSGSSNNFGISGTGTYSYDVEGGTVTGFTTITTSEGDSDSFLAEYDLDPGVYNTEPDPAADPASPWTIVTGNSTTSVHSNSTSTWLGSGMFSYSGSGGSFTNSGMISESGTKTNDFTFSTTSTASAGGDWVTSGTGSTTIVDNSMYTVTGGGTYSFVSDDGLTSGAGTHSNTSTKTDNFNVNVNYGFNGTDWSLVSVGGSFLNSSNQFSDYNGAGTFTSGAFTGTFTQFGRKTDNYHYSGIIISNGAGGVTTAGGGNSTQTGSDNFIYAGSGAYSTLRSLNYQPVGIINGTQNISGSTHSDYSYTTISTLLNGDWSTTGSGSAMSKGETNRNYSGSGTFEHRNTTGVQTETGYATSKYQLNTFSTLAAGGDWISTGFGYNENTAGDHWNYAGSGVHPFAGYGGAAGVIGQKGYDGDYRVDYQYNGADWEVTQGTGGGNEYDLYLYAYYGTRSYSNPQSFAYWAPASGLGITLSGTEVREGFERIDAERNWDEELNIAADIWETTSGSGSTEQYGSAMFSYSGSGAYTNHIDASKFINDNTQGTVDGDYSETGFDYTSYGYDTTLSYSGGNWEETGSGEYFGEGSRHFTYSASGQYSHGFGSPTPGGSGSGAGATSYVNVMGTMNELATYTTEYEYKIESELAAGADWTDTSASGSGKLDYFWLWGGGGSGGYQYGITGGSISGDIFESGGRLIDLGYDYDIERDSDNEWYMSSGSGTSLHKGGWVYSYGGSGGYSRNFTGGSVGGDVNEFGVSIRGYEYKTASDIVDGSWQTSGSGGYSSQAVLHNYNYSGSGSYTRNVNGVVVSGTVEESGSWQKDRQYYKGYHWTLGDSNWTLTLGTAGDYSGGNSTWGYSGSGSFSTSTSGSGGGSASGGSYTSTTNRSLTESGTHTSRSDTRNQYTSTNGASWIRTYASGSGGTTDISTYTWSADSTYHSHASGTSSSSSSSASGSGGGWSTGYSETYDSFHSEFITESIDESYDSNWATGYSGSGGPQTTGTYSESADNSGTAQFISDYTSDTSGWSGTHTWSNYSEYHSDQLDTYDYSLSGSGSIGGGGSGSGSSSSASGAGTNDVSGHQHYWGNSNWTDSWSDPSSGSGSWSNVGDPGTSYSASVNYDGWYNEAYYQPWGNSYGGGPGRPTAGIGASPGIHGKHGSVSHVVDTWWYGPYGTGAPTLNSSSWLTAGLLTPEFSYSGSGGTGGGIVVTGPASAENPHIATMPIIVTETVEVGGDEPDADVRIDAVGDTDSLSDSADAATDDDMSLEDKQKLWDLQARLTRLFSKMKEQRQKIDDLENSWLSSNEDVENAKALLEHYEDLEEDIRGQISDLTGESRSSGFKYDAELEEPDYVGAIGSGLKEGARAVGNAAVDTVANFATVGSAGQLNFFGEGVGPGSGAAYGFARGGTELLFGIATGAASKLGTFGKVVFGLDLAGNTRAFAEGGYSISQEGLNWRNGIQTIGGALGVFGNVSSMLRGADDAVDGATDGLRGASKSDELGEAAEGVFTNPNVWKKPPSGSLLDKVWRDSFDDLAKEFDGTIVRGGKPPINPETGKPIYGTYDPRENVITLFDGADDVTYFHELLHWQDIQKALEKGSVTREWIKSLDAATWKQVYRAGEERVWSIMRMFGFDPA